MTQDAVQLKANQLFWNMLKASKDASTLVNDSVLLGIDPGETTGVCFWKPQNPELFVVDQIKTPNVEEGLDELCAWIVHHAAQWPTLVTIEDYKVYAWKKDQHIFSGLHTPQVIGALRRLVYQQPNMELHTRMAHGAKMWATDQNLRNWGLYYPGLKHGRDALRHVITTKFFGQTPLSPNDSAAPSPS